MSSIKLSSPAKLNLFLKVINKRRDGYHNLKTLFERVNLCDELKLTSLKNGQIRINCDNKQVPLGPKNLCHKAAKILKEELKVPWGVQVQIKKRIPVAAGLAGGSSNAATTLLGLNRLWNLKLKRTKICKIGQKIGSDVPFFLHECSWALGEQRGNKIHALAIRTKLWHILVVPCVKMYSREVFTRLNLQLTKANDNVNILIRYLTRNNINKVRGLLSNDLESSILLIRPSLKKVVQRLKSFNDSGVIFSGSGPTVFTLSGSEEEAERIQHSLRKYYKRVYAVRTL